MVSNIIIRVTKLSHMTQPFQNITKTIQYNINNEINYKQINTTTNWRR